MLRLSPVIAASALLAISASFAAEPQPSDTSTVTFEITGLHCPPCTRTVETSLKKMKGIRSVRVDFQSKRAKVEFEEGSAPAQKIAQAIAKTPHMMGSSMHYSGKLLLKAPKANDEKAAKQIEAALGELDGVKTVKVDSREHTIAVTFDAKGKVTSTELLRSLEEAGIQAEAF